jgi:membrane-associated phospholipid phosphatase
LAHWTAPAPKTETQTAPAVSRPWAFADHERVFLSFFGVLVCLGLISKLPVANQLALLVIPVVFSLVWTWETQVSRPWSRVTRQWSSLVLILVAYWAMQLFAHGHSAVWQDRMIGFDRMLLHQWGLQQAIEAGGPFIPGVLETCYSLLYAMPVAALGALYLVGERRQAGRFLRVLFLGALAAYALLPVIAVASPRVVFPDQDLPNYVWLSRKLNCWLLDHLDISTSVFPSGHVAVAFSCVYGLVRAVPGRRLVWGSALVMAFAVWVATIYGRYHYAADGLASVAVATLAWLVADWIWD